MTYVIAQVPETSAVGLQFYGGAREFWRYKGAEAMLSGPYETGKTVVALTKLHLLLCKYPGSRALMARKTYKSLIHTAVVTYEMKVLPYPADHPKSAIEKYGGEKPEFYDYPNGSRLVCGGLDYPEKVLSGEYDFIYVNQAEQTRLNDWENLVTRATGRAGNAPYTQVMGDCNPDIPTHWIQHRRRLRVFEQRHEHNPALYDQGTGEITPRGRLTLEALDSLTGLRYKRGRLGLWVAAEGQVYDNFDPDIHVIDRFEIPHGWRRYRAVDFGYTNPFCCQWWAEDSDGRLYLYREIYMTRRTVREHAELINSFPEAIEFTVADHDAEDRATLLENGIPTLPAQKALTVGIQKVQERLRIAGDDKPRIFFLKDSLIEADRTLYREYPGDLKPICTEQEFTSYVWPDGKDGRPNREVPLDLYNHGMDAARYLVMARDGGAGSDLEFGEIDALSELKNYRGY